MKHNEVIIELIILVSFRRTGAKLIVTTLNFMFIYLIICIRSILFNMIYVIIPVLNVVLIVVCQNTNDIQSLVPD